ncbi:MAG: hypothetical protein ABSH17_08845 [Syntrophobacteraceae bacterium]
MNANVAQKQQKEQGLTPQEQFTGKNLTGFGGVGLLRRFFEKCKLRKPKNFSIYLLKLLDLPGRGEFHLSHRPIINELIWPNPASLEYIFREFAISGRAVSGRSLLQSSAKRRGL